MRPVIIGEAPPAVQETEGDVLPSPATHVLQRQQLAGWSKQFTAVDQGFHQIAGGVKHVCRNYQVISVGFVALAGRVPFNVKRPVLDRNTGIAETTLSFGEKACGDIGEHVVNLPGG